MAASKQTLTPELMASLGKEFLEVPNVSGMFETHNVIVGAATKEDTLKNAEGIKDDIYHGRVTVDTITQEQINKYIEAGHPYFTTYNKLDKVNTSENVPNILLYSLIIFCLFSSESSIPLLSLPLRVYAS